MNVVPAGVEHGESGARIVLDPGPRIVVADNLILPRRDEQRRLSERRRRRILGSADSA